MATENENTTQRYLLIDNENREPINEFLPIDPSQDSGRTYVFVDDSLTGLEEIRVDRKAHVVFAKSSSDVSNLYVEYATGDRTGMLHVIPEVSLHISDSVSPFPVAFRVYSDAFITLPNGLSFEF